MCNWGISDITRGDGLAAFSCLSRENAHCSPPLPVDLPAETLVILKIQARISVCLSSWPYLPSVQLPQRIPLFFHKVAHFIGPWRGLESVSEEASMLLLNLGQSTERSRKLVEGEERKRLSMLHNHEGPSKEMRVPF